MSSELEFFRITIKFRGCPVDRRADFNPATMAKMPSNTATVKAIPNAVRMVVVLRTRKFRKLYERGKAINELNYLQFKFAVVA